MTPVRLLRWSRKTKRFDRALTTGGIPPNRKFPQRFNNLRLEQFASVPGIVSRSVLSPRWRTIKFAEMVQMRWFPGPSSGTQVVTSQVPNVVGNNAWQAMAAEVQPRAAPWAHPAATRHATPLAERCACVPRAQGSALDHRWCLSRKRGVKAHHCCWHELQNHEPGSMAQQQ